MSMSTGSDFLSIRSINTSGKFKRDRKIGPLTLTREWISEWRRLKEREKSEFARKIIFQEDLVQNIVSVFDNQEAYPELFKNVVMILMEFSQSIYVKLRYFVFYFVPTIVYVLLKSIQTGQDTLSLEVLLRTIYEVDRSTQIECGTYGAPIIARIPNINHSSIYTRSHVNYIILPAKRSFFRRRAKPIPIPIRGKPEPRIFQLLGRKKIKFEDGRLRGSQKLVLCSEVWWMFNHTIPRIPPFPIPIFLKYISKIVTKGFPHSFKSGESSGSSGIVHGKRIRVSPALLIEMIQTTFYSIFNGGPLMGEKVLLEISQRADYDLVPEAMTVAEAVKNYVKMTWHTERGNWRTRTILMPKERNFHLQFESVPINVPFWKLIQDPKLFRNAPDPDEIDSQLGRDFSELSAIPNPVPSGPQPKVKNLYKPDSPRDKEKSHRSLPKTIKKLAETLSHKTKHKK